MAAFGHADCYSCLSPAHNYLKVDAISEVIPSFVSIYEQTTGLNEFLGLH